MVSVIIYREMNVTCYFHHSNVNSGLNTKMKHFQTLFWSTQVIFCSLPLPFVPSLFFLFLTSFISKMHKHTHMLMHYLQAHRLSHVWLCNHMNCSLPNASVYRILQTGDRLFSICTNSFQQRSLMYTFYLNARIA